MHASTPSLQRPDAGREGAGPTRRGPVTDLGRILLGVAVVALGVVFLLDSAGAVDAGTLIDAGWPVLLVAAGILTLLEHPPAVLRGCVLVAGGAIALLFTTGVADENAWSYLWPLLVIAAGLLVLARSRDRALAAPEHEDDIVRATAIFGGPRIASTSASFRGAFLTSLFGGITLDLRGARLAPEGATVDVTVAFGGIDILVPRGWRISVRSTPIFGGLDDKTDHTQDLPDDAPVLHIDAVAVFGGVDVTHDK